MRPWRAQEQDGDIKMILSPRLMKIVVGLEGVILQAGVHLQHLGVVLAMLLDLQ